MAQATKRIRLEQRVMPVSSEEELSLVTLREQNKKLSNNYSHRLRVEQDLRKKIEQLEESLRQCEEKEPENQLIVIIEDLRSRNEDLEFQLNKSRLSEQRLADDLDRISNELPGAASTTASGGNLPCNSRDIVSAPIDDSLMLHQDETIQDLNFKLADQTELANNRLKELEQLNEQHREALLVIDRLKHEAKCIPRETIIESAEYKTLQSHFSVLYNEATQLKIQLIESKQLMIDMKNDHARQIERMESEEQRIQRELRTNIIDLEMCLNQARDQVAEIRRENDRLDKANESTLKLDTELKKSLNNYKIQVAQKNNELQRLKRKIDELKHSHTHKDTPSAPAEFKETLHKLQKQLDKTKSEEDALMQELDVTGQAYEDMQDQNHRLLQQIEEKDEAIFKLMSEQLKNNALQKHLNDEKLKLEEMSKSLQQKIEQQERLLEQMEEHMKLNQSHSSALENEMALQKRLNDEYKKEKLELSQQLAELNSEKEKIANQLESIQKSFTERASSLSHESFKNKRLIEELESIKKKYERASKLQSATTPDEVLMEEIREYKEQLTCPSCKTKPKDAVLTKCFHVFCFDCLKTRVDTRQRKCPKCNAQFGANDFHRLYLA